MFGFDDDIPYKMLVDKIVWWVCFSQSGLSLTLDDGSKILVFDRRQLYERQVQTFPVNDSVIIELAGAKIVDIVVLSGACMEVSFEGGFRLQLFDKINDFENFAFIVGGVEYVV